MRHGCRPEGWGIDKFTFDCEPMIFAFRRLGWLVDYGLCTVSLDSILERVPKLNAKNSNFFEELQSPVEHQHSWHILWTLPDHQSQSYRNIQFSDGCEPMALPTWVIGFARPYAVRRAKKSVKVYWQALSCLSSVNDSKVHVAAEDEEKENLFSSSPQQRLIHQTSINLSFICRWGSQFAFAITKPLKVVYRRGSFTPVRRHFSTAIIKPHRASAKRKKNFISLSIISRKIAFLCSSA